MELLQHLKESALAGDLYYLKAQAYRTLDMDHEEPYQVSTTFVKSVCIQNVFMIISFYICLWLSLNLVCIT